MMILQLLSLSEYNIEEEANESEDKTYDCQRVVKSNRPELKRGYDFHWSTVHWSNFCKQEPNDVNN